MGGGEEDLQTVLTYFSLGWGGGGGFADCFDLFFSRGDGALFLFRISSFKLGPVLGAMSSSSSVVSAMYVTT